MQAATFAVASLVALGYGVMMDGGPERIAVLVGAAVMLLGAVWSFGRSV